MLEDGFAPHETLLDEDLFAEPVCELGDACAGTGPARFGCACCADALSELLAQQHIDLERDGQRFLARQPRRARSRPQTRPRLFFNARILTMDAAGSEAEALLIRDGKVLWCGTSDQADARASDDVVRIDCQGRTLVPGFIEPHMHLAPIAALRAFENVGPFRFPSFAEALEQLKRAAKHTPAGEWLMGRQFDPSLQEGPDVLTAAMLDEVSTEIPVFVYNASLHFAYCNSAALALAGIDADTEDPPGSSFGRLPDGSPDGVLQGGGAMAMVARHNTGMRAGDMAQACLDVLAHANQVGVTTVCDQGVGLMQGAQELELYRAMRESGQMTARYRYALSNNLAHHWDKSDLAFGDGDEWMRASAWKIVSDGSNQGRSGLQREPFLDSDERGVAYIEPDELELAVSRRLREGWPVNVHANGDLAIDRVLDAFAAARAQGLDPGARRCRIEHCSILHDEQIEKMRALGLSPSFLIGHVHYWGKAFRDDIFGAQKAALLDRTAACEQAGIRWTLHSDEPVTEMGPLRCIENAVTRRMWKAPGEVLAEKECVSVEAALRAMTRDAAWQCHSDHEIGSLEPGKLADFVLLEQDPRSVTPERISQIRVLETWVGGERVYSAPNPRTAATMPS